MYIVLNDIHIVNLMKAERILGKKKKSMTSWKNMDGYEVSFVFNKGEILRKDMGRR